MDPAQWGGEGPAVPVRWGVVGLGDGGEAWPLGGVALGAGSGPACLGGWNAKHVFRVAAVGGSELLAATRAGVGSNDEEIINNLWRNIGRDEFLN